MQMQMQVPDCSSNSNSDAAAVAKPEQQQLDCPRCGSNNTKFCYYNNYNTSQPRHFCKGCRRYWTKGGALRNVPIGGGTRKKSSKRVTKKNIAKPVNVSSVSAPVITEVDYPVVQHQPVPVPAVAAYQPMMPTDLNGYFGNFNLSIAAAGFPLAVPPEMQSSTESSGGENEMFTLNGDFSYLYGGWQ